MHKPGPAANFQRYIQVRDDMAVQGLTPHEGVALAARSRSPSQQKRMGWSGSWTNKPDQLSNEYFKVLLDNKWEKVHRPAGGDEYRAVGHPDVYMQPSKQSVDLLDQSQHQARDLLLSTHAWAAEASMCVFR